MRVIGEKNQISEDVFDFMISYLPFPQKSIRSELAKLFSISIDYRSISTSRQRSDNQNSAQTFIVMVFHSMTDLVADIECYFRETKYIKQELYIDFLVYLFE